ncbi:POTRA domain-containing protein [Edaphobacter bradus]|uniref:POTRA domain-containing protein n=1 Tax=Edaphobacter bradus TaxID=2259016 RepID=UPI0021E09192|nr:POTRA domain-containing protein [Edaphobacter bradus]
MRLLKVFLPSTLLSLLFCSTILSAQSIVLPKSISFSGDPTYSQTELLTFTGLKPGASSTIAEVQAAAQKLNDTGLFSDIHFESNAHGLVFSLKPMPNMLPARFTNFVWWTPDELNTALKFRVPLYEGSIPQAGNMQDTVCAALKAMLAEKGVTATVVALASSDQPNSPPTAVSFAIDSPEIHVRTLTFASASPAMQTKFEKVVKDATSQPYDQFATNSAIDSQVRNIYRNEGYLDAVITTITHSAPQISNDAINLDLTATINEGEPYRISQLTWPGSEIVSTDDLNKKSKLHPEELASEIALKQTLQILYRAYYAKGFQDAKVQASSTKDAATHHVAYTIRVIPGEQYRLHAINVVGLTDQQRKDFDAAWPHRPATQRLRRRLAHEPRRLLRRRLPSILPYEKQRHPVSTRLLRHLQSLL